MTTTVTSLQDRYADVRARVAEAAARAGRGDDEIILVAVTKYAEPDQIKALLGMGHRDFGENQVQQLVQRAAIIEEHRARLSVLPETRRHHRPPAANPLNGADPDSVRWHMIGHVQRNKVRKLIDCVRLIHSVDSLRLAEEIQQIALKRDETVEVLIQADCAGESTKFGCPLPAVFPLVEQIETMMNVRVRGMMTMAPYSEDPEDSRPYFARCRELFEEVRASGISDGGFNLLSMGMSGDYRIAIEEGANIVRVGSAIFGERGQ